MLYILYMQLLTCIIDQCQQYFIMINNRVMRLYPIPDFTCLAATHFVSILTCRADQQQHPSVYKAIPVNTLILYIKRDYPLQQQNVYAYTTPYILHRFQYF